MLSIGCVAGELVASDSTGTTLIWTSDGFVKDEKSRQLKFAPGQTHAIQSVAELPIVASVGTDEIIVRQNEDESRVEVVRNGLVEMSVQADGEILRSME
jgi:hypothetical protein